MNDVAEIVVGVIRDLVRDVNFKLMNTEDKIEQYALVIELEAYHNVARKLDELLNGTKVNGD